ncbi:hypothetical protein M7I_7393 [Glarea lozoyensis 74030]|uniref:DUF7820 domain-containing protein n=1 Tax=Glarea lozoyensis (strain ATCC 74030 / MF5533) TaxID=1104152 RepID=H0EX66_GLAL7|nr:hypothetical protein M7I_7393 [Glarea lozoyensis 74030]
MAYVRPESPYRGPTGPSHPYQMYPQESRLARTASMATTSTAPITERSYAGPSGPTHPYDGHTEELPPYTQYPDEAFARKTRPTVTLAVPNGSSSGPAMAMAPGAGGIGLATRNPEFASQEDLNSPQSRGSIMSDLSGHNVNTAAANAAIGNEKPQLKSWQKAARRKVCGIIPVWVFGIIAISFIFFGIILGTVLSILKPKHSKNFGGDLDGDAPAEIQNPSSSVSITTMTTTYDATPLTSIPTGTPDLPTGEFIIPITAPQLTSGPLHMTLTQLAGSPDPLSNIEMILEYGNDSDTSFSYGAQAPQFQEQQVLRLVNDVDETSRGPAWWFQMSYNKLVILKNTDLAIPLGRREIPHGVGDFSGRKGTLQ